MTRSYIIVWTLTGGMALGAALAGYRGLDGTDVALLTAAGLFLLVQALWEVV